MVKTEEMKYIKKIIGHPVMIGDVLDYYDFEGTEFALLEKWKKKRLPLEEQSDECIDFIYNLIFGEDE